MIDLLVGTFLRASARRSRCRCSTRWCRRCHRRRADRGAAAAARWLRLHPARRDHGGSGRRPPRALSFEFTPILKPLEPFRDSLVVVSDLTRARRWTATTPYRPACWLTGTPPKRTDGPDFAVGVSVDQVIARRIGQETTFPSLEIATEDFTGLVGACDPGYSCAYMNTLNWQTPTTPLPMEINPRVVFERLFGSGGTAERASSRGCAPIAACSTSSPAI